MGWPRQRSLLGRPKTSDKCNIRFTHNSHSNYKTRTLTKRCVSRLVSSLAYIGFDCSFISERERSVPRVGRL
jgi:hypothetical protein